MRWIFWALCLLAAFGWMHPAAGAEFGPVNATSCPCNGQYGTLGAPACAGSFYGMVPGCCESPPSACDNAWDGYCEEKARWKAFWYRVGTGSQHSGRHGVASYGSTCVSCVSATQPQPSVPTATGQDVSPTLPDPPMPPEPPVIPAEPTEPTEPTASPPLPGPVPEQAMLRLPFR